MTNKETQRNGLRGIVGAYYPAAAGSNPENTIYAFFNLYY